MNECGANGRFSIMARASIKALRSDIELESVLRCRSVNSRCANGEVHIDGLGVTLHPASEWQPSLRQGAHRTSLEFAKAGIRGIQRLRSPAEIAVLQLERHPDQVDRDELHCCQ